MRTKFSGHHFPTDEQYKDLWQNAIIVPDANVLLDLYRLPSKARDELVKVLQAVKERIWVPYQVALEFQRNRPVVIADSRKNFEKALTSIETNLNSVKNSLAGLELEKRGVESEDRRKVDTLDKAAKDVLAVVQAVKSDLPELQAQDPLRILIDDIIGNSIGEAPDSQAELEDLILNADVRFLEKIPPGFKDSTDKGESFFYHNGVKYLNKHGDLIFWRQLLSATKSNGFSKVILITRDTKEDWWWIEDGKRIGPHPELIYEASRVGGIDLYWQYSPAQFLKYSKEFLEQEVSEQTLKEVSEVSLKSSFQFISTAADFLSKIVTTSELSAERAVESWLIEKGLRPKYNSTGFPDFTISHDGGLYGIEVKETRQYSPLHIKSFMDSVSRGYVEVKEGRLTEFSLIIVIRENPGLEDPQPDELIAQLKALLSMCPIRQIIVGFAQSDGTFSEFVRVKPDSNQGSHLD